MYRAQSFERLSSRPLTRSNCFVICSVALAMPLGTYLLIVRHICKVVNYPPVLLLWPSVIAIHPLMLLL